MSKKEKTIQIPVSLFVDIYMLVIALEDEILVTGSGEIAESVRTQIDAKFDAMNRRELYTSSKVAPTEEEREKARKEYLDEVGMRQSFRY